MYKYVPTLTDFVLQEERKIKNATGSFTILLTQIENAAKSISDRSPFFFGGKQNMKELLSFLH